MQHATLPKTSSPAGVADEILVQLSYCDRHCTAAQHLCRYLRHRTTSAISEGQIAERIGKLFDLRPAKIVERFGLRNPIFEATASYGHFGGRPYTEEVTVWENGRETTKAVEFFSWEELDAVDKIRAEFGLK